MNPLDRIFSPETSQFLKNVETYKKKDNGISRRIFSAVSSIFSKAKSSPFKVSDTNLSSLREIQAKIKTLSKEEKYQIGRAAQKISKHVDLGGKVSKKKTEFSELLHSIHEESSQEIHWLYHTAAEEAELLHDTLKTLDESEDPSKPLEERKTLYPKTSSSGVNGALFAKSKIEGSTSLSFVMKSDKMEMEGDEFDGFEKGKGVIRERIAYSLQQSVRLPLGCPVTAISTHSHSVFNPDSSLKKALKAFTESTGMTLSIDQALEIKDLSLEDIQSWIKEELSNLLDESLLEEALTVINGLESLPDKAESRTIQYGENIERAASIAGPSLKKLLYGLAKTQLQPDAVKKAVDQLQTAFEAPIKAPTSLISAQKLVACDASAEELTDKEKEKISPKEFEKASLDIFLMNTDRNLGNILVSKQTSDDLYQILEKQEIPKKNFIDIKDSLEEGSIESRLEFIIKTLEERGFTPSLEIEQTIYNLLFIEENNLDYCYTLTMIDHGLTLPDPEERGGLDYFVFGCGEFAQAKDSVLSGGFRKQVLSLDIAAVVQEAKKEMEMHVERFGEKCRLPDSCFHLMHINGLVLQTGAKIGSSLKHMDYFFSKTTLYPPEVASITRTGGEIKEIYEYVKGCVDQGFEINWDAIQGRIEEILTSRP